MHSASLIADPSANSALAQDLARRLYVVTGIPVDAVDMSQAVERVEAAAASRTPYFISTPNLNFLITSLTDEEFRDALFDSDLCLADGMPIIWICRLLRIPIQQKVSGSDLFDALRRRPSAARPIGLFLFGGQDGVAEAASRSLNDTCSALRSRGVLNPGFGSIEEIGSNHILHKINASGADFLVCSLGAHKGQLWLYRNRHRITIPIRAHLGATVNFTAGTIKRAPLMLRNLGLEWLWRIKEEPHLWRRYAKDGMGLLGLLFRTVLPLAVINFWLRVNYDYFPRDLRIVAKTEEERAILEIEGDAIEKHIDLAISAFQEALTTSPRRIVIDLSRTRAVDARFLGLLLMLKRSLSARGGMLELDGLNRILRWAFKLNGLDFILKSDFQVLPKFEIREAS